MSNKDLFKKFMCGIMSVAIIASASTAVLATTTETDFTITSTSAGTEKTYIQLEAVVVEVINETSIMVDWFDSSYGRTVVYCDDMPKVSDGDKVFVISDGSFMETYPMQLNANKVFVFTETVTAISNNEDIEDFLTRTEEQTEETTVLTAMREWVLGFETIIQIDSTYNRMKLSNGQILDCIDGAELNRYVEIYEIDYLIYKVTCMDMDMEMENYVTLTSEERENLILPDEPLTTYSELNPDEEVTSYYVTEPTTVSSIYDDVTSYYSDIETNISSIYDDEYEETYETTTTTTTTTFEYHDSATYEMTTTLEYCDTGMNETMPAESQKNYAVIIGTVDKVIDQKSIMIVWEEWMNESWKTLSGRAIVHCDNMPSVEVGEHVYVYFAGEVLVTDPAQIYAENVETEAVPDIANKQARGIVKEINDLGYVVEVGELLITVEKELIIDDELAIGDIIGFYGWHSVSIYEPNPLNWGQNTEIMKITLGDVDGDGEIRILDIIEINKHIVGSTSLSIRGELSADIDNNGRITMSDNLSIAMYLCKKITNLNDLSEDIEVTVPEETTEPYITSECLLTSIATTIVEYTTTEESIHNSPFWGDAKVVEVIDDNTANILILINDYVVTAYYEGTQELSVGDIVNFYCPGGYGDLIIKIMSKKLLGDANLDGEVNELDIELINSHIAKEIILSLGQEFNADVNSDFKTDAKDVSLIEKYIAGEISSFEEESTTTPVETTEPLVTGTEIILTTIIDNDDPVEYTTTELVFDINAKSYAGEIIEIIDDNTVGILIMEFVLTAQYDSSLELSVGDIVNVYNPGGKLTLSEYDKNYEIIGKRLPGDLNLDGKVNELDVEIINGFLLGEAVLSRSGHANADVNEDTRLDLEDAILLENYITGEISSFDDIEIETVPAILCIGFYEVIEVIDANNFIIPWDDGSTYQITFRDTPELSAGDMVMLQWGGFDGPLERRMISVTKVILGDANMDGELNALDAEYIRSTIASGKYFGFDQVFYADVNFDNEVTIDDAIIIEKYIAGEISSFDEVDVKEIEEIKLKEVFLEAMKDEEVIKSYINYLEIEPSAENINLQLIANVDGYSICFVPSVVFAEAYTIETYDGYTFFAYNIYSTSDTGLYLIKDSEVYTLADAYNLNIIDIKKIYNALPKENYNGEVVAVTDRTDRA